MMVSLQKKFGFTMGDAEFENYVKEEENQVIKTLKAKAQPCVGVTPELEKLAASKKYGMAVVSSSALRRVIASLEKVDQMKFFPPDHIFSAATSLEKPTSKPDPAIYLHACKVIGVKPEECIAIEDSTSGATSAVRAGIHVVGYVGSYDGFEKQAEITKVLEEVGAKVIMKEWSEFDACLKKIEES